MFTKSLLKGSLLSLTFLCLLSPVFAQPPLKAIIKGPKEVLAGTLVFLSNEDAIGDNKVWIFPEGLKEQVATCNTSVFLVLPTPGDYRFGLIVADKSANIDYTFITIKATGTVVVPPPPPPLLQSFTALRKASIIGSSFLQDNETSKRLNVELTRLANAIVGKSLPESKAEVVKGLEQVFATRSYESRKKDWINNWRLQVNEELNKIDIPDTATYSAALFAMSSAFCIDGKCPIP